jgi:hypothetical protein
MMNDDASWLTLDTRPFYEHNDDDNVSTGVESHLSTVLSFVNSLSCSFVCGGSVCMRSIPLRARKTKINDGQRLFTKKVNDAPLLRVLAIDKSSNEKKNQSIYREKRERKRGRAAAVVVQ